MRKWEKTLETIKNSMQTECDALFSMVTLDFSKLWEKDMFDEWNFKDFTYLGSIKNN